MRGEERGARGCDPTPDPGGSHQPIERQSDAEMEREAGERVPRVPGAEQRRIQPHRREPERPEHRARGEEMVVREERPGRSDEPHVCELGEVVPSPGAAEPGDERERHDEKERGARCHVRPLLLRHPFHSSARLPDPA